MTKMLDLISNIYLFYCNEVFYS